MKCPKCEKELEEYGYLKRCTYCDYVPASINKLSYNFTQYRMIAKEIFGRSASKIDPELIEKIVNEQILSKKHI